MMTYNYFKACLSSPLNIVTVLKFLERKNSVFLQILFCSGCWMGTPGVFRLETHRYDLVIASAPLPFRIQNSFLQRCVQIYHWFWHKENTFSEGSTAYEIPRNSNMSDYLYLSTSRNSNGFLSNNDMVDYSVAGGSYPTRSYFAFFPNHRGQNVSMYHAHNLIFEKRGVAVDWRNTGINVSGKKLPNQFFFLTEVHYGGAGCYTSSDRWVEANGTAIGLR